MDNVGDWVGMTPHPHRSKDIEASGFNGTAAFMEVRVQSIVVEFILTHVDRLFGGTALSGECPPCHRLSEGLHQREGLPGHRFGLSTLQMRKPAQASSACSQCRAQLDLQSPSWLSMPAIAPCHPSPPGHSPGTPGPLGP